jgi:hypothetical protein
MVIGARTVKVNQSWTDPRQPLQHEHFSRSRRARTLCAFTGRSSRTLSRPSNLLAIIAPQAGQRHGDVGQWTGAALGQTRPQQ